MNELKRAHLDKDSMNETFVGLLNAWKENNPPHVRQTFTATTEAEAAKQIMSLLETVKEETIWLNDVYQVNVTDMGDVFRLAVKRIDRQPVHDWRDLQAIKNQLVGPECEGIELYPAESRLVDTANQYYLWCSKDPKFRFPFGFNQRAVFDGKIGRSVNRKLEAKP